MPRASAPRNTSLVETPVPGFSSKSALESLPPVYLSVVSSGSSPTGFLVVTAVLSPLSASPPWGFSEVVFSVTAEPSTPVSVSLFSAAGVRSLFFL